MSAVRDYPFGEGDHDRHGSKNRNFPNSENEVVAAAVMPKVATARVKNELERRAQPAGLDEVLPNPDARASMKSFQRKDGGGDPPAGGRVTKITIMILTRRVYRTMLRSLHIPVGRTSTLPMKRCFGVI
jgi:hypothetical protein